MAFILSYGKNSIDANKVEEDSSTLKNIHINDSIFVSYNDESNKVVLTSTCTSFPKNQYQSIDFEPIPESGINGMIHFSSKQPCMCTVDWGDGLIEQYPFIKEKNGYYRLIFRSLNVEYQKNKDSHPWWFYKEDGSEYIPVPPHVYQDGESKKRVVTFEFSSGIYKFENYRIKLDEFPIIDCPDLEDLLIHNCHYLNADIPFDRFGRSTKIRRLDIYDILYVINGPIPEAIFKLKDLEYLTMERLLNLPDTDSSNIRRLGELSKLKSVSLNSCGVRKYVREFNDLSNLTSLHIAGCRQRNDGYDVNSMPDFSEVNIINQNIDNVSFIDFDTYSNSDNWHEYLTGLGLSKIVSFSLDYAKKVPMDSIPEYFKEMRSLSWLGMLYAFPTVERIDTFVNSFYEYIISWDKITMSNKALDNERNQFYGLTIGAYIITSTTNQRPSGVEQAPAGFVLGSSNGTPQTPMEKIYVLKNNYKQIWTIKPE